MRINLNQLLGEDGLSPQEKKELKKLFHHWSFQKTDGFKNGQTYCKRYTFQYMAKNHIFDAGFSFQFNDKQEFKAIVYKNMLFSLTVQSLLHTSDQELISKITNEVNVYLYQHNITFKPYGSCFNQMPFLKLKTQDLLSIYNLTLNLLDKSAKAA